MKCLFLFHDAPLSPNYSGAASRFLASFHALSELDVELYVWRMVEVDEKEKVLNFELNEPQTTSEVRLRASKWQDIPYSSTVPHRHLDIIWKSLTMPINLAFSSYVHLKEIFKEEVQNIQPDLIWAEHVQSAALVTISELRTPWIYSHHDWIYKVHKIRRSLRESRYYFSHWLLESALKRAERSIVKRAIGVITGSKTEAGELRQLGAQNIQVIPTTYSSSLMEIGKKNITDEVRIVHLGSLGTTANYQGLMAYLERAHPFIPQSLNGGMKLVIIGETDKAKPILLQKLKEQKAILTGHICDLTKVLSPYDIAILPYEYDTGYRTKLPLLFQHAQAVVATEAAIAGMNLPGLEKVCVTVRSINDFPDVIDHLVNDPIRRKQLGQDARKFYQKFFTYDAVKNQYHQLFRTCNLICE